MERWNYFLHKENYFFEWNQSLKPYLKTLKYEKNVKIN